MQEKTSLLSTGKKFKGNSKYVLVIHGGAGTFNREGSTPGQREEYRKGLRKALVAGYDILQSGGEAIDAVTAAVTAMEGVWLKRSSLYMNH